MLHYVSAPGDALDRAIKYLSEKPVIAVDTETVGDAFTGNILLISAGDALNQYVFDVAPLLKQNALRPLLDVLVNPGILKIMQNAKYDYRFFKSLYGICVEPLFDTMIAEMLLLKGRKLQGFGLEALADKYANVKLDKSVRETFAGVTFGGSFTNEQITYSGGDVTHLHKIREEQLKLIRKHGLEKVCALEMAVLPAIAEMELTGMYIDETLWKKAEDDAKLVRDQALVELDSHFIPLLGKDMFGHANINYNSPKQLLPALKTLVGKPAANLKSTAEADLQEIDHPVIKSLLKYREKEKRVSTYGMPFLENRNPKTGRIHSEFSQLYTDTGRFSSSRP